MRVKFKKVIKKKENAFLTRKKFCRFCVDKVKAIDYKDIKKLESFIRERGKMLSRRVSGNCAKHQRMVAEAANKARFLALLSHSHS